MFTGLIESTASVSSLDRRQGASRLILHAPSLSSECREGESIAVNGCCLTVAAPPSDNQLHFDLLEETLRRTNLGRLNPGSLVNLERALPADGRIGGHFLQGHVDCTSELLAWTPVGDDFKLQIALPPAFSPYLVEKGSIAVDGISLTVADLQPDTFTIWIIPHTIQVTNLQTASPGSQVNLEFDILAKYVERILKSAKPADDLLKRYLA